MFHEFIWEDKPGKINREQLTRGYIQGGLKMLDLMCVIKDLKYLGFVGLLSAKEELITKESIDLDFTIHIDFLSCYRII